MIRSANTMLFLSAVLSLTLSACGGSSSSPSGKVSGVAQKGPLSGATITFFKLNASGDRSGEIIDDTTDSKGYFETTVPWNGRTEVVAQGVYIDELTGLPSTDTLILRSFAEVGGNTIVNMNLLTHLAHARASQVLAASPNADFSSVLADAYAAVNRELGFTADTDADALDITDGAGTQAPSNAQLLLLSAAISKRAANDTSVTAADLLAGLEADFMDDGILNAAGADILKNLGVVASTINLDTDIALSGADLPNSTDLIKPVWLNYAPVASGLAGQTTDEDIASAVMILAGSDTDGDSLQVQVSVAPVNGMLDISSGSAPLSVVYTPNENFNGSDSFSYTVADGISTSEAASVALTVNAINDVPIANPVAAVTTDEDIASSTIVLDGSDADMESLTVLVSPAPANGTLDVLSGSAPLSVVYTPGENYNGSDSFSYTVSDGTATSEVVNVAITVNAINDAPVAAPIATVNTDEDTASTIVLSGSDVEMDSLQVQISAGRLKGTLDKLSGASPLSVIYTPKANFSGSDSFTYTVFDGNASSEVVSVTILVAAVNDVPVATPVATVTTDEDTTSSAIELTGTDVESGPLTVAISTAPSNGSLVYTGNSAPLSVTYIPTGDYNGSDSFKFTVSDADGGVSDPETVSVSVTAVNDAPVFAAVADQEATQDTAFSVTVGATDADNDTLTYSSTGTALPTWATLDTATGEISGTPDAVASFTGLQISANDTTVTTASNTFDLTVAALPAASCAHILAANSSAADGVYAIDPDGSGGVTNFDVYCDMTTDGGGWAKIYQYPTIFNISSTAAVGNIAVADNTAEAKLSDAQINAFQTLSGVHGSEFRMAGDKHPSGHKLYVRSTGIWQDDITAFQLFNPQSAAGNNLAGCLAADRASCVLGNYTHADYWLDTMRMGGGNLPTADDANRYFIDGTAPRCYNNGIYPERCFSTGLSLGNVPIGDFTMWVRPHFVPDTLTVIETAGDDMAPTDLRDFFQALVNEGNVTNADWLLFDLPGASLEAGGSCTNNAAWALDKYLFYYGGTTSFATWAGDSVDPDGAGTDYSNLDGTTGLQVWAYRSSDVVKTWDQIVIPAQGIRHYNPFGANLGAWSPNYCAVPTSGTDLCLAVLPNGTGTNELYQDGSFANSTTLTIKVGRDGASRMDVCGF